jgi:hypothetical protein
MNTYRKIGPGQWGVQTEIKHEPGTKVDVTLKSGEIKQVTLGKFLLFQYGKYAYEVAAEPKQPRAVRAIGDLSGVLAIFDRAKEHLKFPAIVLSVPAINETVRIAMAGAKAAVPGSLKVESMTKDGKFGRLWYGRVHRNGNYERAHGAPDAIADRLAEFAADPVKVAGEHGHLTGNCCFCNLALKDERSTAVGYGPVCAKHYGLPWGVTQAKAA